MRVKPHVVIDGFEGHIRANCAVSSYDDSGSVRNTAAQARIDKCSGADRHIAEPADWSDIDWRPDCRGMNIATSEFEDHPAVPVETT